MVDCILLHYRKKKKKKTLQKGSFTNVKRKSVDLCLITQAGFLKDPHVWHKSWILELKINYRTENESIQTEFSAQ